jgi:hypothetical protein
MEQKMKGHVKISRRHALLYVPCDSTETIGSLKIKACATLHIADIPNTFLAKSKVLLDEKASVHDVNIVAESHIELVLRNELVENVAFFSFVLTRVLSVVAKASLQLQRAPTSALYRRFQGADESCSEEGNVRRLGESL